MITHVETLSTTNFDIYCLKKEGNFVLFSSLGVSSGGSVHDNARRSRHSVHDNARRNVLCSVRRNARSRRDVLHGSVCMLMPGGFQLEDLKQRVKLLLRLPRY
jgi:hypothetical protein